MAKFELQWEAPEYEFREKSVSWYWLSIVIAAVIVAFAVWEKNFLFGLFVVIAEILFIVWGSREPRAVHFLLNDAGLTISHERTHSFKDFQNFCVDTTGGETGEWMEVIFMPRARFKTPLKILFPESRLAELRLNMKTILAEATYEPTLLDAIEKLLRF